MNIHPSQVFDENASRPPDKRLHVRDLGVVNIYVEDAANEFLKIWREDAALPSAETCFRNVMFGAKSDIESMALPDPDMVHMRQDPSKIYKRNAYIFLLRLLTGLESKREGDSNIVHQFKDGWEKYKEHYPDKAACMERLVQNLIGDARLICGHFANNIRTQNIQTSAKSLAQHKGGQTALIIGGGHDAGNLSPVTKSLARSLSFPGKTSVSEIGVAHPDEAIRFAIIKEFEDLRSKGKLDPGVIIRHVESEELAEAFEKYDRVYSDLPMDDKPDFDTAIIDAWQKRYRQDNLFVHLRGSVERQGTSSPLFKCFEENLTGYFPPEMVMARTAEIGQNNKLLRARAEKLAEYMADCRMNDENVRKNILVREGYIDGHNAPAPLVY